MEPLKKVQVEGGLMYAEPQDIFGNLDELSYVGNISVLVVVTVREIAVAVVVVVVIIVVVVAIVVQL